MSSYSKIPDELYYLGENFSVRSLRKYQLKQILTTHGISYHSNTTRQQLIVLFQEFIAKRREEILQNYQTEQDQDIEYGRGRRVIQKPKKYQDFNSDGFNLPKKKINQKENQDKKSIRQEEEEEESEDSDYIEDSSELDEDFEEEEDEEEFGTVDKKELVQLYKDQFKPIETLIPSSTPQTERTITTRSKTLAKARQKIMIWHNRMKRGIYIFCIIYMMIASIGLGITTYARKKNGYCSSAIKNNNNNSTRTNLLFSLLPSSCIPCPDHGTCSNGKLICNPLYEAKTPFYNIGHVLPIADDCVRNSVLGRYVHSVEYKIKHYLAIRQGETYCQHMLHHSDTKNIPITRTPVEKIMNDLKPNFQQHLPADKIDQILVIALSNVLEDPSIHYWETEDNQRYLGTDRIELSFSCQMKRLYRSIPDKIKMYIVVFISVITAIYGATKDYQKKKAQQQKIDKYLKLIVDQLKQQYDQHHKDSIQFPSPRILTSQLRSLIVDLNDQKTIADWQSVVEKSNTHPHIKKSIEEARGDIVEYWELAP